VEPVFDIVPMLTAARLKQSVRAVADIVSANRSCDVRLDGFLSGTQCYGRLCHRSILQRYGQGAFEGRTPNTPRRRCSRKPVYCQSEKQHPADVPIEASPLRCSGGGEPHAGRLDEHTLQACERFCDTPCLVRRLDIRPCLDGALMKVDA
jgi:hypothetical protein